MKDVKTERFLRRLREKAALLELRKEEMFFRHSQLALMGKIVGNTNPWFRCTPKGVHLKYNRRIVAYVAVNLGDGYASLIDYVPYEMITALNDAIKTSWHRYSCCRNFLVVESNRELAESLQAIKLILRRNKATHRGFGIHSPIFMDYFSKRRA